MPYRIEYSPETEEHQGFLTARQRATLLDGVEERLSYEPAVETRNRKPMRPNTLALWELRLGSLRVYYDIEEEPEQVVYIRAIGVKERNRVRIGREDYEL